MACHSATWLFCIANGVSLIMFEFGAHHFCHAAVCIGWRGPNMYRAACYSQPYYCKERWACGTGMLWHLRHQRTQRIMIWYYFEQHSVRYWSALSSLVSELQFECEADMSTVAKHFDAYLLSWVYWGQFWWEATPKIADIFLRPSLRSVTHISISYVLYIVVIETTLSHMCVTPTWGA